MTAEQAAAVDAYINSKAHRAWERRIVAGWKIDPAVVRRHVESRRLARKSAKNASATRRYAAMTKRTPSWADPGAMSAIYAEARRLTRETGIQHHVDHAIPLQGRLVSGLHVHTNLQILTGPENSRKNNRFEV